MMRDRFLRALVVSAVCVAFVDVAGLSAAHATVDQTPPSLEVDVSPAFVVGSVVEPNRTAPVEYATNIGQLLKWSATDNVAVCSYSLYGVPAGEPPFAILEYSSLTEYSLLGGDYNGDFGGGIFVTVGYLVTARDCTGNATTRYVPEQIIVTQEDGQSATGLPAQVVYRGPWATTLCDCFLWGATRRTSTRGARVTFTKDYDQAGHVAIVMAEGPGRGRASIRVDGTWFQDVDTYASTNTNRVVVFQMELPAGTHSIAIVNHGTAGRPRIDIDAFLTD